MKRIAITFVALCAASCALAGEYTIFQGDGSDEAGFVPPPQKVRLPPPPPRTVSSAETTIPFPPPPVAPLARTEAKKPPQPPVLFTKIRTEHKLDWAATPNDVNNLLKRMKEMVDVNYTMEVKTLAEIDPNPDNNPIIFRSGHYHFEFTPAERAKLRQYVLSGGMLVFNTGLGSQPFYQSAKKELELMFPEVHLQRLSSDHPVFHAYYDLDRVKYRPGVAKAGFSGNEPWFDGMTLNCRTIAVISRWCMAVGWEGLEDDSYQAYDSVDAQKLGVNLFAYATAVRAWAKNQASKMKFVDSEAFSTDKMQMAQIVYDGEWKTRHAGISVLLQTFNLKTDIPVKFGLTELRLSDPKIFEAPLLYLTGHEHFTLNDREKAQLRQYLLNGGFLFAEACCGRKGFDLALRTQLKAILPDYPLTPIPREHTLYSLPNACTQLSVTPALSSHMKSPTVFPTLYGVEVNGHFAVVYSAFGMAGGWEMSQSPYAHGYDQSGALRLGQNILLYAVTP